MQRQTPIRYRRYSISLATMAMLLGSSVGCVSLTHHLQQHSVMTSIAEKHAGRYYHCPHCGQIVPREGFSKCPRCLQVPAFHGYEPTCWRQWPEGWGCPPESAINDPQFLQNGMVESDSDLEVIPETEGQQEVETIESGNDEHLPVQKQMEIPQAEVDNGDVSMPQPHHDIVSTEQEASTDSTSTACPVDPADSVSTDDFVDIEPPADFDRVPVADEPAQTPQTETPRVAQDLTPEPPQVEKRIENLALSDLVTKAAAKAATTTLQASVPNPTSVIAHGPFDDELTQQTPAEKPAPQFEIVSRIPIPTTKSALVPEPSSDHVVKLDPVATVPALLRPPATIINATAASDGRKSVLVTTHPAPQINPHVERGAIPVRRVQLASIRTKSKPGQRKEPAQTDVKEEFPTPVKRVALPSLVPLPDEGAGQPMPIRRIQLSELPVKILR